MNRNLVIFGVIVTASMAGFAAYHAAGAVMRSDGQATHSMGRMKSMTVTDHARLKAELKSFRKMPKADRDRIRSIHDVLQGPESDSQLRRIANHYYRWYKSLGPGSRAELRDERDAGKKLALVEQFGDMAVNRHHTAIVDSLRRGERQRVLSSEDLAAVMQVIEEKLRETGSFTGELDALEKLEGIWRYNAVMKIIFQVMNDRNRESERKLWRFLRDERLRQAISDENTRDYFYRKNRSSPGRKRPRDHRSPPPQGMRWFRLMIRSMKVEYDREIKKNRPSSEELLSYFATLDGDSRDYLMGLPQKKFMRILENRLMKSQPDRFPANPLVEFVPQHSRRPRGDMRPPDQRSGPPGPPRPGHLPRPRSRQPPRQPPR